MMELKMISGPALTNSGTMTAQDIAAAANGLFLDDETLDFNP
jgi:hypothetical protein